MNQQQQAARDRAVDLLVELFIIRDIGKLKHEEIAEVVDSIITAAMPGRSEHADAVADAMKEPA